MTTLTEFDFTATPVSVKRYARASYTYWALDPADLPDAHGCTPHAKLVIDHDKDRKRMTAYVEVVSAAFTAGIHRELILMGQRPERLNLMTVESPRFNAKRFAEFGDEAMRQLTATAMHRVGDNA